MPDANIRHTFESIETLCKRHLETDNLEEVRRLRSLPEAHLDLPAVQPPVKLASDLVGALFMVDLLTLARFVGENKDQVINKGIQKESLLSYMYLMDATLDMYRYVLDMGQTPNIIVDQRDYVQKLLDSNKEHDQKLLQLLREYGLSR
jgi:hypothetical protein